MIQGSIYQEDITIVNIYMYPTSEYFKYIKQILMELKAEIDSNTVIVEVFNTLCSTMDRTSRQKINKEMLYVNYTLDQMGLTDIIEHFIKQILFKHT